MAAPPSGKWIGWYSQYEQRHYFEMTLTFYSATSQSILGYCEDGKNSFHLGFSDVKGSWSEKDEKKIEVNFLKRYRGKILDEELTDVYWQTFQGSILLITRVSVFLKIQLSYRVIILGTLTLNLKWSLRLKMKKYPKNV